MKQNKIFNLIKKGDLEGVKQLFESVDVRSTEPETFLHSITFNPYTLNHRQENVLDFAVSHKKTKIVAYLLQYNYEITNKTIECSDSKSLKLFTDSRKLKIQVAPLIRRAAIDKRVDVLDFVRNLGFPLDFKDFQSTAIDSLINAHTSAVYNKERELKNIQFLLSHYNIDELSRHTSKEFGEYAQILKEKKIISGIKSANSGKIVKL